MTLTEIEAHIKSKLPAARSQIAVGELTLHVEREAIAETLRLLSDDTGCQFEVQLDIRGVD